MIAHTRCIKSLCSVNVAVILPARVPQSSVQHEAGAAALQRGRPVIGELNCVLHLQSELCIEMFTTLKQSAAGEQRTRMVKSSSTTYDQS